MINVSVIIPAHNSANTITETLDSLLRQTIPTWEAIVVDDGSTDSTLVIAKEFSSKDQRIRTITQPNRGVSSARNIAVQNAHYGWLLFLDSDDWIAPEFLEVMTKQLSENPNLDVIHCGWNRIMPDGGFMGEQYAPEQSDLFPTLAQRCAFIIHACIVRKSLVEQVGLFDTTLHVCEDWDLWQKIARTGARFGAVKQVLSYYRMLPMSLSKDSHNFLEGAMRVLERGHTLDLRVSNSESRYVNGASDDNLPVLKLYWSSWLAGLLIGQGKDIQFFSELIVEQKHLNLSANWIAENIFESVLLSQCQYPSFWYKLWPQFEQKIHEFLLLLEAKTQSIGISHRAELALERLVLNRAPRLTKPLFLWRTYAVHLDITEPFEDIYLPDKIERFYAMVEMEGDKLGTVELPVIDGLVSSWVIKDAIAAEFSWIILGRFFEHTIYLKKGDVSHDEVGWETWLQEIWDCPNWVERNFYNSQYPGKQLETFYIDSTKPVVVEVSHDLFDIQFEPKLKETEVSIIVNVGGTSIGYFTLPAYNNHIKGQVLRAALTEMGGFELCRASVREGLLGRPLREAVSLRRRLAEGAKFHKASERNSEFFYDDGATAISQKVCREIFGNNHSDDFDLTIMGRRSGAIETSASRRAFLPVATLTEFIDLARIGEDSTSLLFGGLALPTQLVYAPQVIKPLLDLNKGKSQSQMEGITSKLNVTSARHYFESLFADSADPWKYTNAYEQIKYEQTLDMLPSQPIHRCLELACAEGHFTAQLAPKVDNLVAADISQIALERASERCSEFKHVTFSQVDIAYDAIPSGFDLIVCSEVLYYLGSKEVLKAFSRKVIDALNNNGYFLTTHANLVVDEPNQPGYNWNHSFGAKGISEVFSAIPNLFLVKELNTPLYRIQLFQYKKKNWRFWSNPTAKVVNLPQPTLPPSEVAHSILWNGGMPSRYQGQEFITQRLPILMYHRINANSSSSMQRYTVSPTAFEDQLRYLRDCGFYSTTLEMWRNAMATRTPLPGQAILITFDDGYRDFLTNGLPLLKQYGFSATVFLVADEIGKINRWDHFFEEDLELLNWQEVCQLQAEGIEFGSHSNSHRYLTSLSAEEIVREAVQSRTTLQKNLKNQVISFAYPYGETDRAVQHLIGASGYTFGLSCRSGFSHFNDSLLDLPRLEVRGDSSLKDFIKMLKK